MMSNLKNKVPASEFGGQASDAIGLGYEVNPCIQLPLIDQLRAKRANIARDASKRTKALDRQIQLLEQSDAESIVKQAQDALYNE